MKRVFRIFCIGLCLSIAVLAAVSKVDPVPARAQTPAPSATAASKDACLACHGPFDKLARAAAGYQAPSGEKINPHVYVPHTSKEAKAVPECANCHQPHQVPPNAEDMAALPNPDVQWCYTNCHHRNSFELCKNCHKWPRIFGSLASAGE
jgi:hypothetical protein